MRISCAIDRGMGNNGPSLRDSTAIPHSRRVCSAIAAADCDRSSRGSSRWRRFHTAWRASSIVVLTWVRAKSSNSSRSAWFSRSRLAIASSSADTLVHPWITVSCISRARRPRSSSTARKRSCSDRTRQRYAAKLASPSSARHSDTNHHVA